MQTRPRRLVLPPAATQVSIYRILLWIPAPLRDDDYPFASNALEAYYMKAACASPFNSEMTVQSRLPTRKASRAATSLKVPKKMSPKTLTPSADHKAYDSRTVRERWGRRKAKHSVHSVSATTVDLIPQSYNEIVGSMVELCLVCIVQCFLLIIATSERPKQLQAYATTPQRCRRRRTETHSSRNGAPLFEAYGGPHRQLLLPECHAALYGRRTSAGR